MLPSTMNLIIGILIFLMCLTLLYSLLIMIGGKNIFKKAGKDEKGVFIPIINLFTMLEVVEISTFYGILLFLPVANVFILMIMMFKLGKVFNETKGNLAGLVLFPIIFYPLLAYSSKQYKMNDEEYFRVLDNAKNDNINLLMTDEEIKNENNVIIEEWKEIDSIFKSDIQIKEKPAPYKAGIVKNVVDYKKVDLTSDKTFEPIKMKEVNPVETKETKERIIETKKFASELDKNQEDVEFIDL